MALVSVHMHSDSETELRKPKIRPMDKIRRINIIKKTSDFTTKKSHIFHSREILRLHRVLLSALDKEKLSELKLNQKVYGGVLMSVAAISD